MEAYDKNGKLVTFTSDESDEDLSELEEDMTDDDELDEEEDDFVEDDVGIVEETK